MKHIVNILIIAVFLSDFKDMVEISGALKAISLSPEVLSVAVLICALTYFAVVKKIVILPKYFWLLMFVLLYVLCNVALNAVPPGAIIGGMRRYMKFIPLFIFPLVYDFSDEEIMQKLKLIFALSILQCPIAFIQRFILYPGLQTGDVVRGTMSTSGVLSVYLNCVIAITIAFYLYKKVSFKVLVPTALILFFPMLINETKSTLLLLPVSIFMTIFFAKGTIGVLKKISLFTMLFSVMMGIFVVTYNHFFGASVSEQRRIESFLQERATGYLYKGIEPGGKKELGRFDALHLAYKELSTDPMKLIFGLGMGNVGKSLLRFTTGDYTEGYQDYGVDSTTLSFLLWEVGLFGLFLLFLFFLFILFDCLALRHSENPVIAALSTGWIAVTAVMTFALGYKNLVTQNALIFLFFLISGYLASKKVDLDKSEVKDEEEDEDYEIGGLYYSR